MVDNASDRSEKLSALEKVWGDRYKILQQLSKRNGRQTLLAQDLQTQQHVVIKLLALSRDFDWQDLKLFEREAQTLKTLSHPAIPRYLDYLDINTPTYKGFALVQSYIEGRSLEEHLRAGRTFDETEVKQIAASLLEILIYLHDQSPPVIHRDIKPSNVLLTNRSGNHAGQVYLVDFGSVQNLAAKEGGTITVVGTYGYMPPEQFGGRAVPASDLYSLGATLIFLVTGHHPTELLEDGLQIQFRQAAHLSPNFTDWLEWMTEPSLNRRLPSTVEALEALKTDQSRPKLKPAEPSHTSQITKSLPHSNIVLHKTPDVFEILVPPQGIGFLSLSLLSLVTPLWACWIPLHWYGSLSLSQQDVYLEILCLAIALSGGLAIALYNALFGKIRLRIDRQSVFFIYETLHFKRVKRWGAYQAIARDIPVTTYLKPSSKSLYTARKPHLLLRLEKTQYKFGWGVRTSAEVEWLAGELRSWLKMRDEADSPNSPSFNP
ncbi:serine/threonine protein kinase [Leptolyngbya sp. FACHB-541]|uniref:serine/threonine protein kinase n=1 Tax=Leptolyngbya sp. FACHB-541 TaxID=2692810 RepID=UPI0016881A02|nr:serine/threonine-protein kinase [Leptolyngbya sp. FACHB-541]MBD2000564.1 serine/threonine protein kinase [Leptolyngbya sp. FACHB-541]